MTRLLEILINPDGEPLGRTIAGVLLVVTVILFIICIGLAL